MSAVHIRRAGEPTDLAAANALFAEVFAEEYGYDGPPPGRAYAERLLANPGFVLLLAERGRSAIGAITAYELVKYEGERSEFYIYDLAVIAAHRRSGVATALIGRLGEIAAERGAWVMFVQADPPDAPAVALYDKLGRREEVLHFDIEPSAIKWAGSSAETR